MKLKHFLYENSEKHGVLAFGRFNPITIGHEALIKKVKDVADAHKASHVVVLSHSQDKKKNPLSAQQKLKYAKSFFPGINFSTSDKQSPHFLSQAEKLYKSGITHLHMVAGDDRIPEYKKLLSKYNGTHEGALFNFKSIELHSAGERDPDAEGVTGMSASKMRQSAAANNFREFMKGLPSKAKESVGKKMFDDVRKGMDINESVLLEGVHDQSIFKAVFLAGGPGSGKDYVMDNTLAGHGLTEINSDKALEYLMDREGLDKTMPASEEEHRNLIRSKAKNVTELRQRLALSGRNGLIINGTGDDPEKIARIKKSLEELGYDTSMVMVNTADEVSKQRNIERGQRGGRTVPEKIRKEKWDSVQAARPELAKMFGNNYAEFDNSEDLRSAAPDIVKAKKDEMLSIFNNVREFTKAPPQSPFAQSWIAGELERKDKLPISKDGAEMVPHQDSGAAEEARKLGLKYYGFGRYGKDGKVTHRVVHDKLVQVNSKAKTPEVSVPVSSSGGSGSKVPAQMKTQTTPKKLPESLDDEFSVFLNEAVSVKITGDTVDEVDEMIRRLSNEVAEETDDMYGFSDDKMDAITLGRQSAPFGEKSEGVTFTNNDIDNIMNENKYIMNNGAPKIYILRNSAARDAHQKNGTIEPNKKGKGYLVKLNTHHVKEENTNVQVVSQLIKEARSTDSYSRNTDTSGSLVTEGRDCSCEKEEVKGKISLQKFKGKVKESIDQGIEPGMAMNSYAKEKIRKIDGKVTVTELTGDETTASIGAQKEDELKKKGISLSTFKSKVSI